MRILEAFNMENFQSDGKLRIGTNFFIFYFYSFIFLFYALFLRFPFCYYLAAAAAALVVVIHWMKIKKNVRKSEKPNKMGVVTQAEEGGGGGELEQM